MEDAIQQYFGDYDQSDKLMRNPLDCDTLDNTFLLRKTKVSKYKTKTLHKEN